MGFGNAIFRYNVVFLGLATRSRLAGSQFPVLVPLLRLTACSTIKSPQSSHSRPFPIVSRQLSWRNSTALVKSTAASM